MDTSDAKRQKTAEDAELTESALGSFTDPIAPLLGGQRTAAQDVYQMRMLRRLILSFVNIKSLTNFIRVERGCMRDVARVLYCSMDEGKVNYSLSEDSTRDRIYRAAVTDITAFNPAQTMASHLTRLDTMIPRIRNLFPNARSVVFGCLREDNGKESLSVNLGADEPDAILKTADYRFTHTLQSFSDLPSTIICPVTAPEGWSLTSRFDLVIPTTLEANIPDAQIWLKDLKDNASLGNLHRSVSLGRLKVDLDDLTGLYESQAALGYSSDDRIRVIHADRIKPFSNAQFSSFASVAGRSLTYLKLAEQYQGEKGGIGIDAFHPIITIIREHLPNLDELHLSLAGIERAEAVSRQILYPDILSEGGSIKRLFIYCAPYSGHLFDTVRSLAPVLFGLEATIDIAHSDQSLWGKPVQNSYLAFIRAQPPHQRRHLATISFPDIDVMQPHSVHSLHFRDDGRPYRRGHGKAVRWADRTNRINVQVLTSLVPAVGNLYNAALRFEGIAETADASETLAHSLALLDAFREATGHAQAILAALQPRQQQVKNFVDSLLEMAGM